MKTTQLDRLFRDLDGVDRFRALVAAAAAEDDKTAAALLAACPRVVVRMPEPTFGRLNQATVGLLAAFGRLAAHWIGWLDAIDLAGELILEGVTHDEPCHTLRRLERAEQQVGVALVSVLTAFAETTRPVPGLDSDELLRAMASPLSDGLDRHRQFLDSVEPDEETVAAVGAHFREILDAAGIPEE